jgi:hypothetical protein
MLGSSHVSVENAIELVTTKPAADVSTETATRGG